MRKLFITILITIKKIIKKNRRKKNDKYVFNINTIKKEKKKRIYRFF